MLSGCWIISITVFDRSGQFVAKADAPQRTTNLVSAKKKQDGNLNIDANVARHMSEEKIAL